MFIVGMVFPHGVFAAIKSLWVGETWTCDASSAITGTTTDVSWTCSGGYLSFRGSGFFRDVTATQYWSGTATVTCSWKYRLYYGDTWKSQSRSWTFTCNENPVSISPTSMTLSMGETDHVGYSHKYTNSYTYAANVSFSSSNSKVATVNNSGLVTAVSEGTAYITVYSKLSSAANAPSCKVTVKAIEPQSVRIQSPVSVVAGDEKQLSFSVTPDNAVVRSISWASNDENIVTVSESGLLRAKNHGNTSVYCVINGSLKSNDAIVTVSKPTLTLFANIDDGLYEKGTVVRLTASNHQAVVYYTIDGSTPSKNSLCYSEPICLDKDVILKAVAYHDDYNSSSILTKTYKVTSLKAISTYPNTETEVGGYTSFSVTYNQNINKGDNYNNVSLSCCGQKIQGQTFISENTLYFVPDKDLEGGTYTLSVPQNSLIGESEGEESVKREVTFLICSNGKPYPIEYGGNFVIKSDNSLWMWGMLPHTKEGYIFYQPWPKKVADNVINATSTLSQIFIVKVDGTLWGRGENQYGQLGLGHKEFVKDFTKIADNVYSVACSGAHTLIQKNDGSVWSCGYNYCGELGNSQSGSMQGTPSLQRVPIEDVATIEASGCTSAAIKKDGSLWAWGDRRSFGFDLNDEGNTFPNQVMSDVRSVSLSGGAVKVIKNDNSLWYRSSYKTPQKIMDDVLSYSGCYASYVIKTDGKLYSWGQNTSGQLGDGTKNSTGWFTSYDKAIFILDSVQKVQGMSYAAGVMKTDGSIWTWGSNNGCELGYSENKNLEQLTPKLLFEGRDITYIDKVSFQCNEVSTSVGEYIALPIILTPCYANYSIIKYSTDNPSIATITNRGIVSAISSGSTIIRAHVTDANGVTFDTYCKLNIEEHAKSPKVLTFPDDNKDNNKLGSYTDTWTAKIGDDTWTISNFNNNKWNGWNYIRCGRKANESVASISTDFAIDKAIDNVCVTVDNVSATDKINSISLIVASDKEYNNIEQTVYADLNKLAAGNLIFKVGQPSANKYYKLVFDMQATGVNGIIQISKVQYNGSGDVILNPAQLSFNVPTCSAIIGREVEYPTLNNPNKLAVTYDSSDKSVATVTADGNVTLLSEGETMISVSSAKTDKYEAGYAYYILTVKPATTADIANTPQTAYTVEKALQLIEAGKGLDTKVYVKGKITNIKYVSTQYGNATYTLSDEGKDNALFVYRGNYLGGAKFTAENQIKLNDVVVVYGNLVDYYGTKEFTTGSSIYSINGTSGINTIEVSDSNDATEYNIAGQRIRYAYKGVVIKGGKKFVKK